MKKSLAAALLFSAILSAGARAADDIAPAISVDEAKQELTFSRNGKIFAAHVKWWKALSGGDLMIKTADLADRHVVKISGPAGSEQFWTQPDSPFIFARIDAQNGSTEPQIITDLSPLSVPLSSPPADIKFFTPEGLNSPAVSSSYLYLAAVNPKTNAGVVTGWITHEFGSGIIGSRVENNTAILEPRAEYGRYALPPDQTLIGETLVIGDFADAHDGLEGFADANVAANNIKLKPPMSGYCTWYHAGASNETNLKTLADFAKKENLKDFGFDFLQIDDGWQPKHNAGGATIRDFASFDASPTGKYHSGMKATADALNADGFVAGIWFIPFAWSVEDPVLKDHLDWFVHKPDGGVYSVKWAGDCLDMTNPQARDYLQQSVKRMTHDWGYKYIKIDGLWSGMATTILYPNPKYKPDDLGGAVFFDKSATNISAYRTGLRAVRQAAGDDVFICGCNVAQNHRTLGASIGLLDAMRVGPDIKASWDSISSRAAVYATREYFLNGKVWWNDPDCLMLRGPDITLGEARAWGSFIAISGQLNVVSEDLAKLPPDRFDIVKRTMPNVPHFARPIDLFTSDHPQVWLAEIGAGESAHTIYGLFNWNDKAAAKIPLIVPPDAIAFDYWENKFLDTIPAEIETAPGSCHVLSVTRNLHRPQLVSTSRHVLQGAPDISDLKWDPAANILSGKSNLIANDPYELRIFTGPYAYQVTKAPPASASDLSDTVDSTEPQHLRVKFLSKITQQVAWTITFTPNAR